MGVETRQFSRPASDTPTVASKQRSTCHPAPLDTAMEQYRRDSWQVKLPGLATHEVLPAALRRRELVVHQVGTASLGSTLGPLPLGGPGRLTLADREEITLGVHSAADLARIARSLNNRPRKTLGYMTPSERLAEFLAHTG
jgi:hypothetical protein